MGVDSKSDTGRTGLGPAAVTPVPAGEAKVCARSMTFPPRGDEFRLVPANGPVERIKAELQGAER